MKKRMYIVEELDQLIIREFNAGSRPSNFVAIPPPGFKPGDEHLIEWDHETRKMKVNYPKKVKVMKKEKAIVRKHIRKELWNSSSIWQRIKNEFSSR